jgi:Transposase domain (DUF772)
MRYARGGPRNQPFDPAMIVKVLLHCYATGVFSSRKIARKLHEDVAFRALAAGNYAKHRTIWDFRALHLAELATSVVQLVQLTRECGLVKLGTTAVDGTKIKADSSRHKAMSYRRMPREQAELEAQIKALLEGAPGADRAERDEPQLEVPGEIERREARLAVIKAARERLEARQTERNKGKGRDPEDDRHPKGKDDKPKGGRHKHDFGLPEDDAQGSFADPDIRIMKGAGRGFDQSYAPKEIPLGRRCAHGGRWHGPDHRGRRTVQQRRRCRPPAGADRCCQGQLNSPRARSWPIRGFARRPCQCNWLQGQQRSAWPWAARDAPRPRSASPKIRAPLRWRPVCKPLWPRPPTDGARRTSIRPTAGSRTSWVSAGSACAD